MHYESGASKLKDTSQQRRFTDNNFDLLRLAAATQVLLWHATEHLQIVVPTVLREVLNWFPGVPVFFVISGFLIAAAWSRATTPGNYLKNRVLRIFPGLYVCFSITVILALFFGSSGAGIGQWTQWIIAQLTVLQFYNPDFLRSFGVGAINGSLWSIPVELQFYLFLPLLFKFGRVRDWPWPAIVCLLLSMTILTAAYLLWPNSGHPLWRKLVWVTLAPHLFLFLLGSMIYCHWNVLHRFFENHCIWWFIAYIIAALGFSQIDTLGVVGGNRQNPILSLILGATVISAAYSGPLTLVRILRGTDWSYGIYIYHMLAVNLALEFRLSHSFMGLIAVILLTLTFAAFSWRFVEAPALRLKSRPLHTRSGPRS